MAEKCLKVCEMMSRKWCVCFVFFKQKSAYEMRISDWSSDVCSSDHRERQFALFGEVVVPVGDKLKVTGGGRYFDARQRSSVRFGGVFADPNTGTSSFRNKEDGFNPKLNLAYEFDRDRMVYVQAEIGRA